MSGDYKDDSEESECPICLDELDLTDRSFKPCKCGYQMCRFCWNRINENLNGKCPACRQPYKTENYKFTPPNMDEIQRIQNAKKAKERERKQAEASARKKLANVRVIQRNLVYVTNLALPAATEETLESAEYFGRFGKIKKIVVNRNNVYQGPQGPSVSAYITFHLNKDAYAAIKAVDGTLLDGRLLRASFGTTKYCSYFLRSMRCPNPDCMYLHELGADIDSFTKEDMAQGKHLLSLELNVEDETAEEAKGTSYRIQQRKDIAKSLPSNNNRPTKTNTGVWKTESNGTTLQNTSLNPEEWPDALSSTNTKKKRNQPTNKTRNATDGKNTSPEPEPEVQQNKSALPATASWASKSVHTEENSNEDKSTKNTKESHNGAQASQPTNGKVEKTKNIPSTINDIPKEQEDEQFNEEQETTKTTSRKNQVSKKQTEWRKIQQKSNEESQSKEDTSDSSQSSQENSPSEEESQFSNEEDARNENLPLNVTVEIPRIKTKDIAPQVQILEEDENDEISDNITKKESIEDILPNIPKLEHWESPEKKSYGQKYSTLNENYYTQPNTTYGIPVNYQMKHSLFEDHSSSMPGIDDWMKDFIAESSEQIQNSHVHHQSPWQTPYPYISYNTTKSRFDFAREEDGSDMASYVPRAQQHTMQNKMEMNYNIDKKRNATYAESMDSLSSSFDKDLEIEQSNRDPESRKTQYFEDQNTFQALFPNININFTSLSNVQHYSQRVNMPQRVTQPTQQQLMHYEFPNPGVVANNGWDSMQQMNGQYQKIQTQIKPQQNQLQPQTQQHIQLQQKLRTQQTQQPYIFNNIPDSRMSIENAWRRTQLSNPEAYIQTKNGQPQYPMDANVYNLKKQQQQQMATQLRSGYPQRISHPTQQWIPHQNPNAPPIQNLNQSNTNHTWSQVPHQQVPKTLHTQKPQANGNILPPPGM